MSAPVVLAPRILVIGGGIAGSAAALRIRQLGLPVQLVEKDLFPRPKVCGCCLGGAGLQALQQLGLQQSVIDQGERLQRWYGSLGGRRVELKTPPGIAISREVLDPLLLEAVQQAGGVVRMSCSATIMAVTNDAVRVKLVDLSRDDKQLAKEQDFDVVLVAAGLNGGNLQRWLPWTETPHGPFGIAFTAASSQVEPGVIYMACDDDGYVGLVRLPGGRVDVAAALQSGGTAAAKGNPYHRVQAILRHSQWGDLQLHDPSKVLTTPPLRRSRLAGRGRLLALGDAAGYVEPFTGEGMTWALQSGVAAAELVVSAGNDFGSLGDRWNQRLSPLLRRKKRTCRWVTTALRSAAARQAAAATLNLCPALAGPLLRSLSRP